MMNGILNLDNTNTLHKSYVYRLILWVSLSASHLEYCKLIYFLGFCFHGHFGSSLFLPPAKLEYAGTRCSLSSPKLQKLTAHGNKLVYCLQIQEVLLVRSKSGSQTVLLENLAFCPAENITTHTTRHFQRKLIVYFVVCWFKIITKH